MNQSVDELEHALQCRLPDQYASLLDSLPGDVRDDGLLLYSSLEIVERNQTFGVREYWPRHLLIGDDSGGRGFFLCVQSLNDKRVFGCDLGDPFEDSMKVVALSLEEWRSAGYPLPE